MLHNIFLIRFLSFLGLIGISLLFYSVLIETDPMQEVQLNEAAEIKKLEVYSVWALPSEDVRERLKKLMGGLRSEFGGPQFEPHVTVVGAIMLTEDEARDKFRKGCEGVKAYNVTVEKVGTGTFFYQCVYLLLHSTNEVKKKLRIFILVGIFLMLFYSLYIFCVRLLQNELVVVSSVTNRLIGYTISISLHATHFPF